MQAHQDSDRATTATIISVNISPGGIPKHNVGQTEVTAAGLVGDGQAHEKHRGPHRAVTILDAELLDQFLAEGYAVHPGALGENLTVRGLHVQRLKVGDRLHFEQGPVLELTELRKPCYVLDAVHPQLKHAVVGRCGYLCRVVQGGTLRVGQAISAARAHAG
ncbi:MAG: MOSC domain-containing protein [Planctomycetota bacterium]